MILLSDGLVAAAGTTGAVGDLQWPVFGYKNAYSLSQITADFSDVDNPITNVANPQTSNGWKEGSTADCTITINLSTTDPIDFVGIARHNLGSGACPFTIRGITAEPGAVYETIIGPQVVPDNNAIMAIFLPLNLIGLKIDLEPGAIAPQIAVIYVGKSVRMIRGIPPGYTPLKYARSRQLLSSVSQSGDFLGDVVTSETYTSPVPFRDIDGDWYRANVQPVVDWDDPLFFAWSPLYFPQETSYAKKVNDPQPIINQKTGQIDISFMLTGLNY